MALHLRALTEEESKTIKKWSQARTEEARLVERAQIIRLASEGKPVAEIAEAMDVNEKTVRTWLKRFEQHGVQGLLDAPRTHRRSVSLHARGQSPDHRCGAHSST